jgi:membrane protein YdbS with pleckstrin-like domain
MVMKQLHSGAKWLFFLRGFFSIIFFSVISLSWLIPLFANGVFPFNILAIILPLFLLIGLFVIVIVYSQLAYKFWKYEFTDDQLRIERGIIWKVYSNVPYERIQNVDITRGIIARLCGFSTLNIQTAGYNMPARGRGIGSEGYIPAVSKDEAEKLRIFLIKKISKKKSGL